MRQVENLLRGTVTLIARGPFPERLLNLCAQEQVPCWGLEWVDEHALRLITLRQKLRRQEALTERVGCEVEIQVIRALPALLHRFRRRYAFLVGLALSMAAVCFLSQFILTIQVTGNEAVSTAAILSQLRQQGVRPGVYGPGLDRKVIAQRALLEMPELSWMSINLYGTRLEVVVREAVEAPELTEEEEYYDVVSQADGIILQVEPLAGEALVAEGDTVAKGEVLISGLISMPPPQYSDLPTRYYETHARGRVWARTWRTLRGVIPLQAQVKEYTGEDRTLWSVGFFGFSLDFFRNSSIPWESYDKITTVYQGDLPGGQRLPMMLTAQRCRAYETRSVDVDVEAARTLVEEGLEQRLQALIGPDGQVLSQSVTARVADGMLEVTLNAECREEIGQEAPGTGEIPEEGTSGEQE